MREPMPIGILKVGQLPPQCTFWRFPASLHLQVARQLLEATPEDPSRGLRLEQQARIAELRQRHEALQATRSNRSVQPRRGELEMVMIPLDLRHFSESPRTLAARVCGSYRSHMRRIQPF